MNLYDAESVIVNILERAWIERALDMFRSMTNSMTTVSSLHVTKNWPLSGSIKFRRDADNKLITLKLVGSKFIGTAK